MHHRRGGVVKNHFRNGSWVSSHYRSGSDVNNESASITPNETYYYGITKIEQNYYSFVNPNASCPVCGKPVYFYQSEFDGRVFFDELGPPWSKHPCTDSSSIPQRLVFNVSVDIEYNWQSENWVPLFIKRIQIIDKVSIQVFAELNYEEISLYVKNNDDSRLISINNIAQIREEQGFYIISMPKQQESLDIRAFRYHWELLSYYKSS
ncbi:MULTISPECIES: hypothetical protein [Pseudoalteromonas]|uniref:hypothetical protein n=1 Tax=Pseudoalteromonas TaxID=53246 RepID=UPI0002CC8C56|nr:MULTISPECIES: hypothetical protein [Pseudoalteromonas]ENN98265.1 hypothetical protein J139_13715 [Pseudoalteromonas agarivorans S816]TMS67122.1 hypothetical protein CWB83_07755 [Pseudoalteromonas sp. S1691]TMS71641.1 hypothetical protein CWB86_05145 [Pseudoalteromonas sp. S1731]TMS73749.1 hypothetical protein CWB88_10300 [Pseudoalteromonas sp. S1941]TMS79386.1 hypothetical protein CWB82_00190 [Pseudoalteromonas sp. S1690]